MAIYKDEQRGSWTVRYHYTSGKTIVKRGFKTKEMLQILNTIANHQS